MKAHLTPNEHPRRRRGIPALIALLFIALSAYFWQGIVHEAWSWSLLVLLVSVGSAIGLWRAVVSGHVITTWGEFDRRQTPFAFWLTVFLCFSAYAGSLAAMFFAQPFSFR